jgi:hypothetical protein
MNYDEASKSVIASFYDSFVSVPESINRFYIPGAKLVVSIEDSAPAVATADRHAILPPGGRTIFRYNGQKNGETVLAHVSGIIDGPAGRFQTNEMAVFSAQIDPLAIHYHSVHLSALPEADVEAGAK